MSADAGDDFRGAMGGECFAEVEADLYQLWSYAILYARGRLVTGRRESRRIGWRVMTRHAARLFRALSRLQPLGFTLDGMAGPDTPQNGPRRRLILAAVAFGGGKPDGRRDLHRAALRVWETLPQP